MADETIAELIAKKREADGYDPEFEARLARQWECPSCKHCCTILEVKIPVGTAGDFVCPRCSKPGIGLRKTKRPKIIVGGKSR